MRIFHSSGETCPSSDGISTEASGGTPDIPLLIASTLPIRLLLFEGSLAASGGRCDSVRMRCGEGFERRSFRIDSNEKRIGFQRHLEAPGIIHLRDKADVG